jgi:hypothetical protein
MCMFVKSVMSVQGTKMLVARFAHSPTLNKRVFYQLTCYGNNVQQGAPTTPKDPFSSEASGPVNAMILPVPTTSSQVGFCQSTDDWVTPILARLHSEFQDVRRYKFGFGSLGFGGSYGAPPPGGSLPTFRVGSYIVSVANSLDDLRRVDVTKFSIPDNLNSMLEIHYTGPGWSFIVAGLTNVTQYHPLCYWYPLPYEESPLFIPLRHYHGEGQPSNVGDYDHEIYILGLPKDPVDALLSPPGPGFPFPEPFHPRSREVSQDPHCVGSKQTVDDVCSKITSALSCNGISFGERGLYQWLIKGELPNGDAMVRLYGDTEYDGPSHFCDACATKINDAPFWRCVTCADIDQCRSCMEQDKAVTKHPHNTQHLMQRIYTWRQFALSCPGVMFMWEEIKPGSKKQTPTYTPPLPAYWPARSTIP